MRPIIENKIKGGLELQLQIGHPYYTISMFDSVRRLLYYQPYDCIITYCGDCIFKPDRNQFWSNIRFTNKELKEIFELEEIYPDVDDFNLNNLFNN